MADPLFILAPHRSFTSIVCTMLGQHPQMYGVPELNLFVTETMAEWWITFRRGRALGAHGLLRTVAQLYWEEQTVETIQLAWQWIRRRLQRDTGSVFQELAAQVEPLILVDKSPYYSNSLESLRRLQRTFPRAKFLHLLRHPRGQGESFITFLCKFGINPLVVSPEEKWYSFNKNILSFLRKIPATQKMQVRGEEMLGDPNPYLKQICQWLELYSDSDAIQAMKHPERSPFASFGPPGARLGNDPSFLAKPYLRSGSVKSLSLEGPLSWQGGKRGFSHEVKQLARELGYE